MSVKSEENPPQIFCELASHYGESESKILPKILWKLANQDEAEILLLLPATVEEVAEKKGIQAAKAVEVLEDLFMRGLVVRTSGEGEKDWYALVGGGGGFWDAILFEIGARKLRGEKLSATDRELLDLFEKWGVESQTWEGLDTPYMRVVPVNKSITLDAEVLPYEAISNIVKNAELISVAACSCRLTERKCDNPLETCINLGEAARYTLERGVARRITSEEALKMLEQFRDLGLVHQTPNASQGLQVICNCCSCCCGPLRGLILFGAKNATVKSRYHAVVDEDLCNGCGVCEARCHFGAMKIEDAMARSDPEKCFGCGLCVSECPTQAITLVLDKGEEHIPVEEGWPQFSGLPSLKIT